MPPVDADRLQTLKSPDAMIDVNDIIARLEITKIGDERAEFRFPGMLGARSSVPRKFLQKCRIRNKL